MSDIKVGDIVDVAFKAEVLEALTLGSTLTVKHVHGATSFPIFRSEATKVKPTLPTAFGSVVEVEGEKYLLEGEYWYPERKSADSVLFREHMADKDYIVLRNGV